ncbi:8855_t:CDS:1 [Ambispora gerdemannii]|uniref:8855_t:CDS:1 n=1 Tax=Ambispora gerdemannii TaxID=144530 RepID=A0A9N9BRP2_9GLOM|nr:8855_t:CDS:1 [Ambispora gerdemannii]
MSQILRPFTRSINNNHHTRASISSQIQQNNSNIRHSLFTQTQQQQNQQPSLPNQMPAQRLSVPNIQPNPNIQQPQTQMNTYRYYDDMSNQFVNGEIVTNRQEQYFGSFNGLDEESTSTILENAYR